MLGVSEIKRRLPSEFVEDLYEEYSPVSVDNILLGMATKRMTTLRVNTIYYSIQELMRYLKEVNIKFERVPWYEDALIMKNASEKEIQKLEIYEKGYIYLQSLSSMVPPVALQPKEGERVLDVTAAPGSKTTQMAAMMKNKGYLLANEVDKIRTERLKYNIENQGASIVEVRNGYGEKIGKELSESFDKVLLDAPCSGEGRFIADSPSTYRNWSLKKVKELAKIQKKLMESAYLALKKGGTMVYSTCTLNKEENENVLEWALEQFHLKLVNIELNIKGAVPSAEENKAIKILPSKEMEGFFVAKLKKY